MAKRKFKRKNKTAGIPEWLVVILIIFILSALNASYLLIQRVIWIFTIIIGTGVYISIFLLLIYSILMWYSIFLIFRKKKKAIKFSIIALIFGLVFVLWFYLIGRIIFSQLTQYTLINGAINFLFNLILTIIIISYLKKSKRVKNYLR